MNAVLNFKLHFDALHFYRRWTMPLVDRQGAWHIWNNEEQIPNQSYIIDRMAAAEKCDGE